MAPSQCILASFVLLVATRLVAMLDSFALNGEAEREVNLHVEPPRWERFSGRVVLRDDPRQGVAEASVAGWIGPSQLQATTLASGSFQFDRLREEMLVYARSADGALAGIKACRRR